MTYDQIVRDQQLDDSREDARTALEQRQDEHRETLREIVQEAGIRDVLRWCAEMEPAVFLDEADQVVARMLKGKAE